MFRSDTQAQQKQVAPPDEVGLLVFTYHGQPRHQHIWQFNRKEGKYALYYCQVCPAWVSVDEKDLARAEKERR